MKENKYKIEKYDMRPVIRPNKLNFISACIFKNQQVRSYVIQSSLEKSKINEILFNMPKKKYISDEVFTNLSIYNHVLNQMYSKKSENLNLNLNTPYFQYVTGNISIESWMESQNLLDKWYRSKTIFQRSLNHLKQERLSSAAYSAKKSYKEVTCSGLFFWNRNIIVRFEQADSLIHVLADTYLLSRISKRLKYYSVLQSTLRQINTCLKIAKPLYLDKQFDICINYNNKLKNRLAASINIDLDKFKFDVSEKQKLQDILKLYQES